MTTQPTKYIIGNWKMHPDTKKEALSLFTKYKNALPKIKGITPVICPSFIHFPLLKAEYSGTKLHLGVQNIHTHKAGSFTGEVSASMVKGAGATYVLLGHSERREVGETNEEVSQKTQLALKSKMTAVICIGEKERDRHGHYLSFLKDEILESLNGVTRNAARNIIIAYEPIWRIGGEDAMDSHSVHETVLYIKKILIGKYGRKTAMSVPILYGGSVTEGGEAVELAVEGQVDGFLIGHASLEPEAFISIAKAVGVTFSK